MRLIDFAVRLTEYSAEDTAELSAESGEKTLGSTDFNGETTATVEWTATGDEDGTYTITATVEVSGGSVGENDKITVVPNTTMALRQGTSALGVGNFTVTATTEDGGSVSYTVKVTGVKVEYQANAA